MLSPRTRAIKLAFFFCAARLSCPRCSVSEERTRKDCRSSLTRRVTMKPKNSWPGAYSAMGMDGRGLRRASARIIGRGHPGPCEIG
jgi:hypothetical protein